MKKNLILLHEEALSTSHPIFNLVSGDEKPIYIWDNSYLSGLNYSLKKLVFLYESLCELPITILLGDTKETLAQLSPLKIYAPGTTNPFILSRIQSCLEVAAVEFIEEKPFAKIDNFSFCRFHQYWKQAEKTVFFKNGASDA